MFRQAAQPYARSVFKSFFQLQVSRSAASESAKLKDLVAQMDGLPVEAQYDLLKLVGDLSHEEQPAPLNESVEAVRRHNSSLLRLEGQCVYGRVWKRPAFWT